MRDISCRVFKSQVADWKSNRLSQENTQRMVDHVCQCEDCVREAQAEAQMRKFWCSTQAVPAETNLWAQIADRLEPNAPAARRTWLLFTAPRWTLTGSVALALLAICSLWIGPKEASRTASELSPATHAAPLPLRAASWTVLPDVSQVDPAMDDPAGATTERVWDLVSTRQAEAP